jgi:ABC-type polysaccharide/polyol phosphate export permease
MAGILQAYRDTLLTGSAPGLYLLPAALISVLLLVAGQWIFRRYEPLFADII